MEFESWVLWIRARRREEVGDKGAKLTDLLVGRDDRDWVEGVERGVREVRLP